MLTKQRANLALVAVCGLAASAMAVVPPTQTYVLPGGPAPLGAMGDGSEIFLLTTNASDNPMIADNNNLYFYGRVGGPNVTAANDNVLWYYDGTILRPMAREGKTAFGMGNPDILYGAIGTGTRMTGNGRIMFSASMVPTTGVTTTGLITTGANDRNDRAIWVSDVNGGALSVLARQSDNADAGTFLPADVRYNEAFNLSQQTSSMNNAGTVLFLGALGGPTTPVSGSVLATNNQAIFRGTPGNVLALPIRKGDAITIDSSNPGTDPAPTVNSFGFNLQLNSGGKAFFDTTYVASAVPTIINNHNNYRAWSFDPASPTIVSPGLRESTPASPLIAGGATLDNGPGFQGWAAALGFMGFNNAGQFTTPVDFLAGTGNATANDNAGIMRGDLAGNYQLLVRKGDPAPFTDSTIATVSTSTINLNNNGDFTFRVFATQGVGTTTAANDLVIAWCTGPNQFLKIHREGDAVPHICGATFTGDLSSTTIISNNQRQAVFPLTITGPGVTAGTDDRVIAMWAPNVGLRILARQGDQFEVAPSVFKTMNSTGFSWVTSNNGDGRQMGFTDDGQLAVRIFFTDGTVTAARYVIPTCPADLDDGSGVGRPDGGVDINDLIYFLTQFELGSLEADLDDDGDPNVLPPTPDCGADINDLLFFLSRFEAGC